MPDTVCAGQAQACLIRVARLDDEGAPLPGPANQYISEGMISFAWTPDVATGDEIEQVNGCGDECVYLKAPDRVRKLNLTLILCAPEPELLEMLGGGTVHNLEGDPTGYGLPSTGAVGSDDVSIELWEGVIVGGTRVGYARYVNPRTRGWRRTGSTHQNDVLNIELAGEGYNAGDWGDGPGDDWSDLSDEPVVLYDWALEVNPLPEPSCGAVELAIGG